MTEAENNTPELSPEEKETLEAVQAAGAETPGDAAPEPPAPESQPEPVPEGGPEVSPEDPAEITPPDPEPDPAPEEPKVIKPKMPDAPKKRVANYHDLTPEERENILAQSTSYNRYRAAFGDDPARLKQFQIDSVNDYLNSQMFKSREVTSFRGVFNPRNFNPKVKVDVGKTLIDGMSTAAGILGGITLVKFVHPNAIVQLLVQIAILTITGIIVSIVQGFKSNLNAYAEHVEVDMGAPETSDEKPEQPKLPTVVTPT